MQQPERVLYNHHNEWTIINTETCLTSQSITLIQALVVGFPLLSSHLVVEHVHEDKHDNFVLITINSFFIQLSCTILEQHYNL